MINITKVSWRNFCGYGDYTTSINFKDHSGVTIIEGEHEENKDRDAGDEKLNNSGKTSIIEAIVWGLFGNTTREQNVGDKIINWHVGKNCIVTINTDDGYTISRMRKYKGMTETVVFKDGEDITPSTNKPVQEFINNKFNINYDTFIRSRVFGQFNKGFMGLSDAKMRKVLEWLMNIHQLNLIAESAKAKLKGASVKVDKLKNEIDNVNDQINTYKREVSKLSDKSNNFKDEIENDINSLKNKLAQEKQESISAINKIKDDIKKYQKELNQDKIDVDKLNQEWREYNKFIDEQSNLNNQINEYCNEIDKLKSNLDNTIDENDHLDKISKYEKLINDLKSKRSTLSDLEKIADRLSINIENNEKFLNKEHKSNCVECRQEVSKEYLKQKSKEIKNDIEEKSIQLDKVNNKIKSIKSKINDLEPDLGAKPEPIEKIKEHNHIISKLEKDIDYKQSDINILKEKLDKLHNVPKPLMSIDEANTTNKYLQNIESSIEKNKTRAKEITEHFQKSSTNIKEDIKKLRNKNNPYKSMISDYNKKIRNLEEEKLAKDNELNKVRILEKHINYIKESYRNKKKIKAFLVNKMLPEFNNYLDYYQEFFEVANKIHFDEFLCPKMDKWDFVTSSGGECQRIDLSIMFALSDMHIASAGPQSNFMMLDEVDGSLDPFTMNRLSSLLSDDFINRDDLSNIFIISHRREMKDRFPNTIKVKYKQERSYIING